MIVLGMILVLAAGVAEAGMDTLSHHYYSSIFSMKNDNFWNPAYSWTNKYKNNDPHAGSKFFGSTTFLVWLTDGWHMFKFIRNLLLWMAIVFVVYPCPNVTWVIVAAVISRILYGIAFETAYKKLLKKDTWR